MRRARLFLVCLTMPALAWAQTSTVKLGPVWSRAAVQGHNGVLYLSATDAGAPDRLIGVDTPVADRTELHESASEGGVMKMRPIDSIPVSPGQPLSLAPGGYHVMLLGLRRDLKEGDSFPVMLRFAGAGTLSAVAQVARAGAAAAPPSHDRTEAGHDDHAAQHH